MTESDLLAVCAQLKDVLSGPIPGQVVAVIQGPAPTFAQDVASALERSRLLRRIVLIALEKNNQGEEFGLGDLLFSESVMGYGAVKENERRSVVIDGVEITWRRAT